MLVILLLTRWQISYKKRHLNAFFPPLTIISTRRDRKMADYYINVFLDDAKKAKIADAGLTDKIVTIDGKEAIQVPMSAKELKKITKGFDGLTCDDTAACVLPSDAEDKLMGIVAEMKTLDVMKFAIMKLYNPLAGKAPRSAQR
jgi:hypothetical protein